MQRIKPTGEFSPICVQPVLVYFYTDQRQPCRIVSPLIEEIEDECAGSLKAVKIDAATE